MNTNKYTNQYDLKSVLHTNLRVLCMLVYKITIR